MANRNRPPSFISRITQRFRRAAPSPANPRLAPPNQAYLMTNGRMTRLEDKWQNGSVPIRSATAFEDSYLGALSTAVGSYHKMDDSMAASLYLIGQSAYAAINKKAFYTMSIPLQVVNSEGTPYEISTPVHYVLKEQADMLYWWEMSMNIWGKCYFWKRYNPYGYPTGLEWVSPLDIEPQINYATDEVEGYHIQTAAANWQPVKAQDIIASYMFNPTDPHDGVSPLEMCYRDVLGETATSEFMRSFLTNFARPDAIVTFTGTLTDEDRAILREDWEQFRGPGNTGKAFIASAPDGQFNYQPIQSSIPDLGLDSQRRAMIQRISTIIGINPVLIGATPAGDPLSAQSTMGQIIADHKENVSKPSADRLCDKLTNEWANELEALGESYIIQVDEGKLYAVTRANSNTTGVANSWLSTPLATVNEARELIGRGPTDEGIVQRNPQWVEKAWTLNSIPYKYLCANLGVPVEEEAWADLFFWELELIKAGKPLTPRFPAPPPEANPPAPSGGPSAPMGGPSSAGPSASPAGGPPPSAPSPAGPGGAPSAAAQAPAPAPAYNGSISLNLSHNPVLSAYIDTIKPFIPAGDWLAPSDWHITLVMTTEMSPTQAEQLGILAEDNGLEDSSITIVGLDSFELDDHAFTLHLAISPSAKLLGLQRRLANAAQDELGLELSEYSQPDSYTPHITLCYAKHAPPLHLLPDSLADKSILPRAITWSQALPDSAEDEWQDIYELPLAITRPYLADIKRWRKWLTRKKPTEGHAPQRAFAPDHLPTDISAWIRDQLATGWNENVVMEAARGWIATGQAPLPLGGLPEHHTRYWESFTDLHADMGDHFAAYMANFSQQALWDALMLYDLHYGSERLEQADEFRLPYYGSDEGYLVNLWVGNALTPGCVTAFILAGDRSGDGLMRSLTVPPYRYDAFAPGDEDSLLSVSQAMVLARGMVDGIIDQLNATTEGFIRSTLRKALVSRWERGTVEDALRSHLAVNGEVGDKLQARLSVIANTESVKAYNLAAYSRWETNGVSEAVWQTWVGDEGANGPCKVCRSLHGVRGNPHDGWLSAHDGAAYHDSAHPGCYCFRLPATGMDGRSLPLTALYNIHYQPQQWPRLRRRAVVV